MKLEIIPNQCSRIDFTLSNVKLSRVLMHEQQQNFYDTKIWQDFKSGGFVLCDLTFSYYI